METVYEVAGDSGDFEGAALARLDDIELVVGQTYRRKYRIMEYDPAGAEVAIEQTTVHRRGDWQIRLEVATRLSADVDSFRLEARLDAYESDKLFVRREWDETIPREEL